jgi:glycosyltransferase involved in cell wall biosynthesis
MTERSLSPIISILIPVYNVEIYLHRCLESVIAQTFTDYECILIDDASLDNSPIICDEYAVKDSRFKVLHKTQNEGLQKARRSALDIALAEFVFHLDSDDWIEANALELLYEKQKNTDVDVVISGYRGFFRHQTKQYITSDISNVNLLIWLFENPFRFLWGKLYRKILFDNYETWDGFFGEDLVVNVQIFSRLSNDRCETIKNSLYNYERRGYAGTMPKRIKCNNLFNYPFIKSRLWVESYLKRNNLFTEEIRQAFIVHLLNVNIYSYLRFTSNIKRRDISYIYRKYYSNFPYKKKIRMRTRLLVVSYHVSLLLGKLVSAVMNYLAILFKGTL